MLWNTVIIIPTYVAMYFNYQHVKVCSSEILPEYVFCSFREATKSIQTLIGQQSLKKPKGPS